MTSIHRLITQNNQAVTSIVATTVKPSQAIRRGVVSRVGNGRINLSGSYTGNDDAVIDVKIVSGGATRITQPAFTGVGTGQMSDVAVLPGATEQEVIITLISLGIDTQTASTDVEGAKIVARTAGAIGNTYSLDVDQTGLVFTETEFSLIADIQKGTSESVGAEFDWNSVVGVGDQIPDNPKRFALGNDTSIIHIQHKVYLEGEWKYRINPPLTRDYPSGTRVKFVTGSRSVTLTDGITPEVYPGIVTVSDLLEALRDSSSLVDVAGVIAKSHVDLRTRTDARADSTTGSGAFATGLVEISAGANASTEVVECKCYAATSRDDASLGRERWRLKGSVSGDLDTLVSGDTFNHVDGKFSFKIPRKLPDGYELGETRGGIGFKFRPTAREEGQATPSVGSKPLVLGSQAVDKQIIFEYQERPGTAFDWTKKIASGVINPECLGVEVEDVAVNVDYINRLSTVTQFEEAFFRAATRFDTQAATTSSTVYFITFDIAMNGGAAGGALANKILVPYLTQPEADAAVLNFNGEILSLDFNLFPGFRQSLTIDGNVVATGIGSPGTSLPEQTAPATVSITNIAGTATQLISPLLVAAAATISNAVVVAEDQSAANPLPAGSNYIADSIDMDFVEKSMRVLKSCLVDVLEDAPALALWDTLFTEVSSELNTNISAANDDLLAGGDHDEYIRRWEKACNNIRLSAGVLPKTEASSISGSESCWRDDPSATHWWIDTEGKYLPAFTGQTYVSVVEDLGSGLPKTTKEWAMAILVDGPVIEGDQVAITIGDAGWDPTYQVGDKLFMTTVAASPLALAGGVDGDDTKVWQVPGSADYLQTAVPPLFDNGQFQFRINDGGTPYELGDLFKLGLEAGQFQWRKDGGVFSSPSPIQTTPLSDGLIVEFADGVTPSFVSSDTAQFDVLQPHGSIGALSPTQSKYRWENNTVITLMCAGNVDTILIGLHNLTADVAISDGANNYVLSVSGNVSEIQIPAVSNPTITLTITEGGEIGWLFAGLATELFGHADDHKKTRQWQTLKSSGLNPTSTLRGAGNAWAVGFNLQMVEADTELLIAAINHHQSIGGIPCAWAPHCDRTFIDMVVLPDTLEIEHVAQWSDIGTIVSTTLNLSAYYE